MPLVEAIRAHVFAAERIHADDTARLPGPRRLPRRSSIPPTAAACILTLTLRPMPA
jgi:hypothetical protein